MKTARLRLRLFIVLFVFAIVITFTISIVDYMRLNEQTKKDNELQIDQATESVLYALKTIDKAYFYLDEETGKLMEKYTYELQEKYEQNPDFETWDFKALSEKYKMDIFILDEGNKIVYSNVEEEIGLDFSVCCESFNEILNERRESGELFIDGIDLAQKSGEVKKFSYMATKDKKYLIELGYSLENEELFNEFNFLKIADEIVRDFTIIESIKILNSGGLPFGTVEISNASAEHRKAFEHARENNETVEIESVYLGKPAIYRYVPYVSEYDQTDNTNIKVVEVIYNTQHFDYLLQANTKSFLIQLIIIVLVTSFVSTMIADWFARPVYLAFHDCLTGLKNRAAFDETLQTILKGMKGKPALFMLDLDNFKLVNDFLGHDKGDELLKNVARAIKEVVGNNYDAFRLGGDEFAIIMPNADEEKVKETAEKIIKSIDSTINEDQKIKDLAISVSIGVSIANDEVSPDDMYKKADIALYLSKAKGKNQYQIYSDETEQQITFLHS